MNTIPDALLSSQNCGLFLLPQALFGVRYFEIDTIVYDRPNIAVTYHKVGAASSTIKLAKWTSCKMLLPFIVDSFFAKNMSHIHKISFYLRVKNGVQ